MANYPPVGFHFKVVFTMPDGVPLSTTDTRFQEVSGLSVSVEMDSVTEGGENRFVHQLPKRTKYDNLVLKRGLVTDSGLINWITKGIEHFVFVPVEVMIILLNEQGQPLNTWHVINALPVKWSVSNFNAQENSLVIENLELSYHYFKRN